MLACRRTPILRAKARPASRPARIQYIHNPTDLHWTEVPPTVSSAVDLDSPPSMPATASPGPPPRSGKLPSRRCRRTPAASQIHTRPRSKSRSPPTRAWRRGGHAAMGSSGHCPLALAFPAQAPDARHPRRTAHADHPRPAPCRPSKWPHVNGPPGPGQSSRPMRNLRSNRNVDC